MAGKTETAERFWEANVFSEVTMKGEGRLEGERFWVIKGLGCHAKELGHNPAGSGKSWEGG